MIDIFSPITSVEKQSREFKSYYSGVTSGPGRIMLNKIFNSSNDHDPNFIEQFQTTGTDARVWELYLLALFQEMEFSIKRLERPDFLITKDNIQVFVEATVSQPSNNQGKGDIFQGRENFQDRRDHEFPIKLGSALYSKLKKKYWELSHIKGSPLVLAIAPFHSADSLFFTDASLAQYLYAEKSAYYFDENEKLTTFTNEITTHRLGTKEIPSGFFSLPDSENVSAIIFNNAGTLPKFTRMGMQAGYGHRDVLGIRCGSVYNPDPNAAESLGFLYKIGDQSFVPEKWGQSAVVMHNPKARHPIPRDFFSDCVQYFGSNETLMPSNAFHIFESNTFFFHGPNFNDLNVRNKILTQEKAAEAMAAIMLVAANIKPFSSLAEWFK